MAVKALIFGTDDLYPQLIPFYDKQVQKGNMEIVGCAYIENDKLKTYSENNLLGGGINFDIVILSTRKDFYSRMKLLESQGITRKNIIDGRVFRVHELDLQRLVDEGVAYGALTKLERGAFIFRDNSLATYPRVYSGESGVYGLTLRMGISSYFSGLGGTRLEARFHSKINVGNFTGIGWNQTFELSLNSPHNHKLISSSASIFTNGIRDEKIKAFLPKADGCEINIGNDVWIGRGCKLKCSNPEKPLTIGDGAVIASDSVVVKNVPPYAIVGGNPAKIIKYRFPEKIIEALLRIKWWEWDLDKIHDNFKYFNDIEKFVELHDKGV